MNTSQMKTIYFNTLNKDFRSKSLIILFVITIAVISIIGVVINYISGEVSIQAPMLAIGNNSLVGFLFLINGWTMIISIILGANTIRSDISNNVISQILSFPISRVQYLISRLAGCWSLVIIYYLVSLVLAMVVLGGSSGTIVGGINLVYAFISFSLMVLCTIAAAIIFSMFLNKTFAFMLTFFTTFINSGCNTYFSNIGFGEHFTNLSFAKIIGLIFHYLLPRTGVLGSITNNYLLDVPNTFNLPLELGHLVVSFGLLFGILCLILRRKEF